MFFEGHFVGHPVLAGAAQLHELVLPCVRRVHDVPFDIAKLQNVKFMARIAPGDEIQVYVRTASSGYSYEIYRGEERCSAGKLVLREEENQ